jgi:predicted PilT family ATPase
LRYFFGAAAICSCSIFQHVPVVARVNMGHIMKTCVALFLTFCYYLKVAVPRSAVGVVIGKNGEMIKKIQNETGARVQFQQGRDDNPEERMCALTGTMNQIEDARQRIEELIESVLVVQLFNSIINLLSES